MKTTLSYADEESLKIEISFATDVTKEWRTTKAMRKLVNELKKLKSEKQKNEYGIPIPIRKGSVVSIEYMDTDKHLHAKVSVATRRGEEDLAGTTIKTFIDEVDRLNDR
jgi:hypothetical protein